MRPPQAGSDPTERAPLLPRVLALVAAATVIAFLTWLWAMTRTVVPEDHARMDSTFRELRSLDRIVNQDVLKARLEITRGYDLVRRSYRRIEQLESIVAVPPSYLDPGSRRLLANALADYRAAVTTKQRLIEDFKYRVLVLDELLAYLPGAGTGVAHDRARQRRRESRQGRQSHPAAGAALHPHLQQGLSAGHPARPRVDRAARPQLSFLSRAAARAHPGAQHP